jgi:hypothetical protein
MSRTRSEMIGMTLRKFPMVQNTSYYGVQVVHCVRRLHRYRKSLKTTKYAIRAVVCVSMFQLEKLAARSLNQVLDNDLQVANSLRACKFVGKDAE